MSQDAVAYRATYSEGFRLETWYLVPLSPPPIVFAVSRVEDCCCDCRSYSAVLMQKTATNQSEPHFYRFDPTTVSDLGPSLIRLEEVWTPYKVDDCVETNARSMSSMRLINVKAFLEREELIRKEKRVDRRAKVLEFSDDRATEYAILSHRWVGKEVDYDEMVELAKMDRKERDEIRQRGGYQKILRICGQAHKDGYEWLWVDTCCIDKRRSAELHDVPGSSFPTARDKERCPNFNGWPEWLQELTAPSNVQFLVEFRSIY
ncbi:hypothetical protein SCLCIDRAFT_1223103 [Scleroderma citrinum Foug A]|uniref:Heterokaryon incompatibility domain-containing protein n=1 Tax=Scleroderma citrinum Foug A TaxID=1036808 RepID=A0A0C3D9R2_9AGAM|nr:hypothetical protein SCLCIDRAFT_1223103 [Scleroderma citrinum Foug A]